jgi:hypothetical protein
MGARHGCPIEARTDRSRAAPPPAIPIDDIRRALAAATDPFVIKEINAKADAFEQYMHDCGLYSIEDMRPINETRMLARWKLGRALAKMERATAPGKGKMALNSLTSFLDNIGLTKPTTLSAQRIGALPEDQLPKVYEQWRERGELLHYGDLIVIARPYWYKASRERKHREIHAAAVELMGLDHPGPFPLIYADPPWEFEIYSEKGAERTPGQHYPTLSDEDPRAADRRCLATSERGDPMTARIPLDEVLRMLASVGADPRHFSGTRAFRCPACSHLRKKKFNKCLSIHSDADGFFFRCFHCDEFHGSYRYDDARTTSRRILRSKGDIARAGYKVRNLYGGNRW